MKGVDAKQIVRRITGSRREPTIMRQGKVHDVQGSTVMVSIGSQNADEAVSLPYFSFYSPTEGDIVWIIVFEPIYIVLGNIVEQVEQPEQPLQELFTTGSNVVQATIQNGAPE